MKADRNAMMALAALPGTVFSGATKGRVSFPDSGGHHGYDPNLPEMYTGFIAAGAGITKGLIIPEIHMVDIAPLVMTLLGVPFQAPDGTLYPNLVH